MNAPIRLPYRLIAWLGLLAMAVTSRAVEVLTLTGQQHRGDLVAISPQEIRIKTSAGEIAVPVLQLLSVDLGGEAKRKDKFNEVELVDGSVLGVSSFAITGDQCELKSLNALPIRVPLARVATILRDAHDAALKQQWNALLRKRGPLDLLVVTNEGKLDALEGTAGLGTAAGDALDFTLAAEGQKMTPKLSRAQGFVFVRKPDPNAPPVYCKVFDNTGNMIIARSVQLNGDQVSVESVAGATIAYPNIKDLIRLDFSKGKLTYLSDLEPVEKDETSTEDLVFPYRRDHNLYGGTLRLKGTNYSKGMSLHSRTALTFDIGGDYREFRALLGVDDVVRSESGMPVHAVVTIEADGRQLFKGNVESKDEPKPLALDVQGVRRLRITVSSPVLDLGNQVNLCEARVTK